MARFFWQLRPSGPMIMARFHSMNECLILRVVFKRYLMTYRCWVHGKVPP